MLPLTDKLTLEKVDSILVKLLPREKSPRRRMNQLETFVFTKAQEERVWLENYLLANGEESSDDELDKAEKKECTISLATLLAFEAYLKSVDYWHNHPKTSESVEARIMDSQVGRWLARFPQNRGRKSSKNVSGTINDAVREYLKNKGIPITSKKLFWETSMILAWHPELEDNDRVLECRWVEESREWDLVVIKPDGQIIGNPTKTIADIIKEGIIARSRTIGASGRQLKLDDAFLGLLDS